MDTQGLPNVLDKTVDKRKVFPGLSMKVHELNEASEQLLSSFIVNNPNQNKIINLLEHIKCLTAEIETDVHKVF